MKILVEDPRPGMTCTACGEKSDVALVLGSGTVDLCSGCGDFSALAIQNKLWRNKHFSMSREDRTAELVADFSTYEPDNLLDELVMETTRWVIGPLEADECRVATAILERLHVLGIARKVHREGCKVWTKYRICGCPWALLA